MITEKVDHITKEEIQAEKNLKSKMESGEITDAKYSLELMKLINQYSDKLQHILDRNYKYIIQE